MAAQIAVSSCTELRSNPGYYLRSDAQKAWDRAVAAFGKLVLITGAWRSYETQLRIFEERYDRGNLAGRSGYTTDVRWWSAKGAYYTRKAGTAAAAVPGTSNHGGGVAVDVKTSRSKGDLPYEKAVIFGSWTDSDRTRFLRVAAEHGWDDDEGRSVGELWHLTYYPNRDQHRGESVPTPPQKETFPMALSDKEQELLADRVRKLEIIARRSEDRQRELIVANRTQAAAIQTLAENIGVDPKVVTAAIEKAMKGFSITLTNQEDGQ